MAELYRASGWWQEKWKESDLQPLITGSFAFVVATDTITRKAIGMGRVISDGVSDGYLQDIAVLPSCRNQGIGQRIVEILVEICRNAGIDWIGLVAQPGTFSLYHRCGFQVMEGHIAMKYQTEEK